MHAGREAGFTLKELAELFEISAPYVSWLLRGQRRGPVSRDLGSAYQAKRVKARKARCARACELREEGKTLSQIAADLDVCPATASCYLFDSNPALLYLSSSELEVLREDRSGRDLEQVLSCAHKEKAERLMAWRENYVREYRCRPDVKRRDSARRQRVVGRREDRFSLSLDRSILDGEPGTFHHIIEDPSAVDPFESIVHSAAASVLGDLTESDFERLTDGDLATLRTSLEEAGIAPSVMETHA